MILNSANLFYNFFSSLPFETLVLAVWGSYLAVFLFAFCACFFSRRVKLASKRPYLALTNAYTAVNLALFIIEKELYTAIFTAVIFWIVGYLSYGVLCLFKDKPSAKREMVAVQVPVAVPQTNPAPKQEQVMPQSVPTPKNSVRLEHAVSVTDKLLTKNLAKTDRQELEKLKNTLAVLQVKGTLTATETEILNENFNALLKLMAKYNV